MKARIIEHILSILLVILVLVGVVATVMEEEESRLSDQRQVLEPYLKLDFIDFSDPLHVALLRETMNAFTPDSRAGTDSILSAIQRFREEQFTTLASKTGAEGQGLTTGTVIRLGRMYLQFILIFLLVMVVSYHASQSLAIFRFVRMKQGKGSYIDELLGRIRGRMQRGASPFPEILLIPFVAIVKTASYMVLFAPAYVIAYSFKTGFESDSYLFMIVLGVISNGFLITYANKFYTFLIAENRKGYVETAIVKNLPSSYRWGKKGVTYKSVLHPKGFFSSHVFWHIYINARYQYLQSLKEHASFLITGLIIIEMALNIQGHLGYELLRNILYKRYDIVVVIVVGIFLIVKVTEIVVDIWFHLESRKYGNKR